MTGLPTKQSLGELLEEAGKMRQEIEDACEAVRNGKPSHSLSPREADKELRPLERQFVKNNNTNMED
jgi:hypothetical protein